MGHLESTREITKEELATIIRYALRAVGMSFDSMETATQEALIGDLASQLRAMIALGYGILPPEQPDANAARVVIARG